MCLCGKIFILVAPFQFDEEFLNRQEAQSELVKYEEKIVELQAELQAFRSQVKAIILCVCLVRLCVCNGDMFCLE